MIRVAWVRAGLLAILMVAAPACLPDEKLPQGHQILATREARALPALWQEGDDLQIAFDAPLAPSPRDQRTGSLNVLGARSRAQRILVPRWLPDDGLVRIADLVFTTDGALAASPQQDGAPSGDVPEARDLVITSFQSGGLRARHTDFSELQFLARRYTVFSSGDDFPRIHVGDIRGISQAIGNVRLWAWVGDGVTFFVRGSDNAFMRLLSPEGTPELLLNEVGYFSVTADARWALATFLRDTGDEVTVLDLQTLQRRVLPGLASDCRVNVRHPVLPWVICMGGPAPGPGAIDVPVVRIVDLQDADVRDTSVQVRGALRFHHFNRDGSRLVLHDARGVQVVDLVSGTATRWAEIGIASAFSPDEQYLLVKAAVADPLEAGQIIARLAVLDGRSNLLGYSSPPNHSVGTFGFLQDPRSANPHIVYDASVAGHPPELLLAPLPPTDAPPALLATGVRKFGLGSGRVIALVEVSQDRTGHLMLFSPDLDESQLLSTSVLDFAVASPTCPGCLALGPGTEVAFIVRGRVPRNADGLWLAQLPRGSAQAQ